MTDTSAGESPVVPPATPPPSASLPTPDPGPPGGRARRSRWLVSAVALAVLLAVLWALAPTRPPEPIASDSVTPAAPVDAPPPVLAETLGEEGHLGIAVISLDRVAADTVELRLAVTNTAPAGSPALDIAQRFSADGPDRGTLAEVYLADLTHERKFFVLRDARNAPLGSREDTPLAAGERRVLWARYPAPRNEAVEVVVHVPHADPMPNVPVGSRQPAPDGPPSPP